MYSTEEEFNDCDVRWDEDGGWPEVMVEYVKIIISKLLNLDVKNELQINKHKLYLKKQ